MCVHFFGEKLDRLSSGWVTKFKEIVKL